MPLATSVAPSPSTLVKMEDRKRPAVSGSDDIAPPSKRQQINGASKSKDENSDPKEESWIEEFQKDAIYRQMLEYKRKTQTSEERLGELKKAVADHDDHLRIIDSWWLQLVQEVAQLAAEKIPYQPDMDATTFLSPVEFKDCPDFQRHLSEKSQAIRSTLDSMFARLAGARGDISPEAAQLQATINGLLASQKQFMVKLDRLTAEKEQISQELNTAILRYFKAEKKLDRAKSAQVQKLEQQALAQSTARPAGPNGTDSAESNVNNEATQLAFEEATAAANKQKEQLEAAMAKSKALQEELTTLQARVSGLTDEDYSKTDLFGRVKSHNEDLIKRINALEATNKKLREEAEQLRGDRVSFQRKLEAEAQALTTDLEDQLRTQEGNLSRVRAARDEHFHDLSIRKQRDEDEKVALENLKELVSIKEARIETLEAQLEKHKPTMSSPKDAEPDLDTLSIEELKARFKQLQQDYNQARHELDPMEATFKRTWALSHKKVLDVAAMEEKVRIAAVDKAKSEHKYFAARKDTELKTAELKSLRAQNTKSSDIISQLREAESSNRLLIQNLEKQMAAVKQSNATFISENQKLQGSASEASRQSEQLKSRLSELDNRLKSKDGNMSQLLEEKNAVEVELEKAKTRLSSAQKDRDSWKHKFLSNSSDEEQMLRTFALCTICRSNFKNTMLRTCGHLFCKKCVEDRISNRMRKCPNCSKPFDKSDALPAHF